MIFVILLLLILLGIEYYICEKCLMLIVKPVRHSYETMRRQDIDNGFSEAIDAYENKWNRKDFELNCDDAVIRGELIINPHAKENKAAIICHGHTANRYSAIKYAKLFYDRGYNIVIYDERFFGRSGGDFSTLGEKESKDLAKIIDFTRETFKDCFLALHGESMGAATALLVLQYEKADLVIADCPFSDSTRLFNEYIVRNMHIPPVFVVPFMKILARMQYRYHITSTSPIKAVSQSDVPICFMHGTDDTLIVCDHSKVMYDVCRNPLSELNLFDGADHAMSIVSNPKRYEEILDSFLRSCNG